MSEGTPIKEAAQGVTEGILNWTKDHISALIEKLQNRELAFIQDPKTIRLVKEIKTKSEWQLWDEFIVDGDLRVIVQSGIALRNLEGEPLKLTDLRSKIESKFGVKGLHQAQFVQNKILGKYIDLIISDGMSKIDVIQNIESLLNNIDNYCFFIKDISKPDIMYKMIENRLLSGYNAVVIFASGNAIKNAVSIIQSIPIDDLGYYISYHSETNDGVEKQTTFIVKQR